MYIQSLFISMGNIDRKIPNTSPHTHPAIVNLQSSSHKISNLHSTVHLVITYTTRNKHASKLSTVQGFLLSACGTVCLEELENSPPYMCKEFHHYSPSTGDPTCRNPTKNLSSVFFDRFRKHFVRAAAAPTSMRERGPADHGLGSRSHLQ